MEMTRRVEKSNFSLTCSLLSQFIKEKGSFADLGIGMPNSGKSETYHPPATMNLLPCVNISGEVCEGAKENLSSLKKTRYMELFPEHADLSPISPPAEAKELEKAQLTIFYGGKVLVFDNFPVNKAQDLMQIAGKEQHQSYGTGSTVVPSAPAADLHSLPLPAKPPANFPARAQPNFSDLPLSRKASLHRFLQKRKDRISAQAPYQQSCRNDSKDVSVAEEISQPWLGLGPHVLQPDLSSNCRS